MAVPSMGAVLHTLNIRLFARADRLHRQRGRGPGGDRRPVTGSDRWPRCCRSLETVHTVIVVGDGRPGAVRASGKKVLRYDESLAAESDEFDWPDLDENSAAAMCYTSGTTGQPERCGVRASVELPALDGGLRRQRPRDRASPTSVLPIVPMFHANAWGLPYAALMAGADLVLPDRFMDAKSLVDLIETQRPTVAGAVPTIWNDVMNYLDRESRTDISSLRMVACGGSAVPVSLMKTFEEQHGVQIRQLWGMTETSPLATLAWPPPGVARGRALGDAQHAGPADVRCGGPHRRRRRAAAAQRRRGGRRARGPRARGSPAAYYRGRDESKFASRLAAHRRRRSHRSARAT